MKKNEKNITAVDLPDIGFKGEVAKIIESLKEEGLDLELPVIKALKDHFTTAPEKITRSFSQKVIKSGFIKNGQLDENTHLYPDMHMIMQTCKKVKVTEEYEHLIIDNFNELYNITKSKGHIPEEVFDNLGFPQVRNHSDQEVCLQPFPLSSHVSPSLTTSLSLVSLQPHHG